MLGMALEEPRDVVEVILEEGGEGVVVESVEGVDAEHVCREPERNSAAAAVRAVLDRLGVKVGVRIRVWKGVPMSSGLGSSGASAAAAVYAVLKALGEEMSWDEMVWCAAQGEKAVAGAAHADNVAPALLGGVCAIVSYDPLRVIKMKAPEGVSVVIARPLIPMSREEKTKKARELLPSQVPFKKLVQQTCALTALLLGLAKQDYQLMGLGIAGDVVVEPARSKMIPGFNEVKKAALEAGAYGCTISGAGPSVFALASPDLAETVAAAMREAFSRAGVERVETIITRPSNQGARGEPL